MYPERAPVFLTPTGRGTPQIAKNKFLVPLDLTVGQFMYVIRKRMQLDPQHALFVFVGNACPPTSTYVAALFEEHRDEHECLHMSYSTENTFG